MRTVTKATFSPVLRGVIAVVGSLLILAATLIVAPGELNASSNGAVPSIDNNNRRQVANTYRSAVTTNLNLNSGWNGSVQSCNAGSTSNGFDTATIESINWFRRMAGLANVVEDPAQSRNAQRAALMMQVQNQLSHSPGQSWSCYSPGGAAAARTSNLTLGINGTGGVLGQIEDPGASNEALGHRRWLLFPELTTVGIGNTSRASSVRVINNFGRRSSESNWVAWPPAGFVPDEVIFDRWSIGFAGTGNVDFSRASVRVTENGRSIGVRLLPVVDGFGDPTLGFEVPSANPTAIGDTVYRVEVSGVTINGRSVNRSYTVTAFDADAATYTCQGHPATIVGTSGNDTIRGTDRADVIVGLGGDDRILGLGGNDIVCGGRGNDTIEGGAGSDSLRGAGGNDILKGGAGTDVLSGGRGRDNLRGQFGADRIVGGANIDVLNGGPGNDTCFGWNASTAASSGDQQRCESSQ